MFGMQPVAQTPKKSMRPNARKQSMRKIVQKNFKQFKKTVQCAWDQEGCSQAEINNARILAAEIIGGLIVLAGGLFLVGKKVSFFDQGPKSEENFPELPKSKYEQRTNIDDIKDIFKFYNYRITDKAVHNIKKALDCREKERVRAVYEWMMSLIAYPPTEVTFESPAYDFDLWKFFRDCGVIPGEAGRTAFYTWDPTGITGIAYPNPLEGRVRIGSGIDGQESATKKGMED